MKGYGISGMENRIEFAEEILAGSIEGFHRYCLFGDVRPDYVSRNLCEMLGCSAEELLAPDDGYAQRVHPEDRASYRALQGFSTLADVTAIRRETEELREISRTVPCGILKYTCEESPRVTYINDQMLRMLRFDNRTSTQLQQYRQNIYLMIPLENRAQFQRFLGKVYADGRPLSG